MKIAAILSLIVALTSSAAAVNVVITSPYTGVAEPWYANSTNTITWTYQINGTSADKLEFYLAWGEPELFAAKSRFLIGNIDPTLLSVYVPTPADIVEGTDYYLRVAAIVNANDRTQDWYNYSGRFTIDSSYVPPPSAANTPTPAPTPTPKSDASVAGAPFTGIVAALIAALF